jgi:hypothetical protein
LLHGPSHGAIPFAKDAGSPASHFR